MSEPEAVRRPGIGSVELVPEYPGMIRIMTIDGTRWHYLADARGVLELGRPVITQACGYRIVFFWPLEPYSVPRVIQVDPLAVVLWLPARAAGASPRRSGAGRGVG